MKIDTKNMVYKGGVMSTRRFTRINRLILITVALMMAVMIFAGLPSADYGRVYASGETAKVTADLLYVRSGPGTNYSRIGSLSQGKTFVVKGSAKDSSGVTWYKLNYGSKTGYVSSKYVNIKQNSVISVSNTQGTVNTKTDPLTVRSGPGSSYKSLGSIAKGKTFTIKGKVQDFSGVWWYTFDFNGKTGYVSSAYVKTSSTSTSVTEIKGTTGTVNTKTDPLTVRSGPGASYSSLGTLAKGKTFAVTGKAQDSSGTWWYRLTYSGKTGYVSSKYVTVKTDSGATEKPQNSKGTVNTKSDPLTVRSGPGTSYGSIGTLAKGKTFEIVGSAKDTSGKLWYKLTYNGRFGYVSADYVKVTDKEDSGNTGDNTGGTSSKPVTFQMGTTTAPSGLNVRSGPGTNYSRLTTLPKGTAVTITGSAKASDGKVWYKYQYSAAKDGYICSDYVTVKTVTSDSEFESYMTSQGFPESYKPGLRVLHASHPQWIFKSYNVGYTWSQAISKETANVSTNLVSSSSPVSYRSTAPGSYNSATKTWSTFDGGWYAASDKVVAYYMDPRNFLSESGIYQFMTHKYDSGSQSANTVAAVINGSFMQSRNPGGGYSSYSALINAAGKNTGVNPNVLAAMIIQEQGWNGSSLVSGTYPGYQGYYNFFNIGAYTTSSMNAIQRGLWYAKGSGVGATSYSRPWNTPYKSIEGGAKFYSGEYVSNKQDSYYTKKFNVKNGVNKVGTHQYMTNVAGAAGEGSIVKRAYSSNDNYPVVFEIPVYNSMPVSACQLP